MAKRAVANFEIYSLISDATKIYSITRGKTGYIDLGKYSFIKVATQAEAAGYPPVPDADISPLENVGGTAPGGRGGNNPPGSAQGDIISAGNSEENKPKIISDPTLMLTSLDKNMLWEIPKEVAKPVVNNIPGMLAKEYAQKVSDDLKVLVGKIYGNTSTEAITAFIPAMLQIAITYCTSSAIDFKDDMYVTTQDGKKVSVEDVYTTINSAASGSGSPNPVRQYLTYFTPTIISGLLNGKFTPNERVMASHGVPKKFFPFCLDVIVPNYNIMNENALIAHQLAKRQAIANKVTSRDNTLHNLYQLTKQTP